MLRRLKPVSNPLVFSQRFNGVEACAMPTGKQRGSKRKHKGYRNDSGHFHRIDLGGQRRNLIDAAWQRIDPGESLDWD